ncbi:unnamed protein product [Absidia cylindrospora]
MSIIKPLPMRVMAILYYECNDSIRLYTQKYITIDDERQVAKTYMANSENDSLLEMIKQVVFYTLLGLRSIFTLVLFFRSLLDNASSTSDRLAVKAWFLQTLREHELGHDGNDKAKKQPHRKASFIAILGGFLNDRLIDKVDCLTYFTSDTLETLNIIPCKARFERRCQRLANAPMKQQDKKSVAKAYDTKKVNKIIHHYILATMEMDNEDHGYATIPLDQVSAYETLFRSYLCGDDKVDGIILMDTMLDLFMDEILHNHVFWMQLIRRCSDVVSTSHKDKTSLNYGETIPTVILANVFWIKLDDFHSKFGKITMELCAFNYALALLMKDDLVSLTTFFDHCICSNHEDEMKQLVKAMFSIGDVGRAIWVMEEHHDLDVALDEIFRAWMQDMMLFFMDAWPEKRRMAEEDHGIMDATSTTPTPIWTRKTDVGPSPLSQVVFSDDLEPNDDQREEIITSTLGDGGYDCFTPHFFYKQSKTMLGQHTPIQLFKRFISPCVQQIGVIQLTLAPIPMNSILPVLQDALNQDRIVDGDRAHIVDFITSFVLPSLAYHPLPGLHDCLKLLTTKERLRIYLAWHHNESPLRMYRWQTKWDLRTLLDNNKEQLESDLASSALKLPVDVAATLLDEIETLRGDDRFQETGGVLVSRHTVAKVLWQRNQALALDALAAQLAYRLATFDIDNAITSGLWYLPPHIHSLYLFASYLFDNDGPASKSFYQYLGAFQQQNPATPLPTVALVRFMCSGAHPRYKSSLPLPLLLSPPPALGKRKVIVLETPPPRRANKRQRRLVPSSPPSALGKRKVIVLETPPPRRIKKPPPQCRLVPSSP